MRVYVNAIPPEGLDLREDISASELELETEQIHYPDNVSVTAHVSKEKDIINVDCSISLKMDCVCSRCLAEFESEFKKNTHFIYKLDGENIIDLKGNIKDTIILEYPMKLLCKPDCKGLCYNCGRNLNAGPCECGA